MVYHHKSVETRELSSLPVLVHQSGTFMRTSLYERIDMYVDAAGALCRAAGPCGRSCNSRFLKTLFIIWPCLICSNRMSHCFESGLSTSLKHLTMVTMVELAPSRQDISKSVQQIEDNVLKESHYSCLNDLCRLKKSREMGFEGVSGFINHPFAVFMVNFIYFSSH